MKTTDVMETKKISKLSLKKETIGYMNPSEMSDVNGGVTTSFGECTGLLCCETNPTMSIAKSCLHCDQDGTIAG